MADVRGRERAAKYLWCVGCAGSRSTSAQKKVTQALAEILKAANVKFAILGKEETLQRRPGAAAWATSISSRCWPRHNIETLNALRREEDRHRRARTASTRIKNEYPQFGGNYEVVHHTEFIAELIKDGRLKPARGARADRSPTTTPATSGRYNDIYDAPRDR